MNMYIAWIFIFIICIITHSFKMIVAQKSACAYNAHKFIVYDYVVLIALWSSYF